MSATNSTANYELPIFLATDKPAWLTDWNGAMSAIDTAIHTAQAAADGAQTTASAATADISTINASLTTITGNITSLTTSVNSNTGAINTINSLIGNGEPTTTDKTLIGAINEIYGMITGGGGDEIKAENVSYDNTTSGMTADDVQEAIDELHNSSNIAYDNTASGLTATNVKAALDELATGGSGSTYDFDLDPVTISTTFDAAFAADGGTGFDVKMLINSAGDIGKIYGGGGVQIQSSITGGSWVDVFTISGSGIDQPSADYNVDIGTFPIFTPGASGTLAGAVNVRYVVKTNGNIICQCKSVSTISAGLILVNFSPCVIFFKDLGD